MYNKNMKKNNQQGGLITLIIVFIVIMLVMSYMGLTFTGIFDWLANLFYSVK